MKVRESGKYGSLARKAVVCALSASMALQPLAALADEVTSETAAPEATEALSPAAELIKQAVETGHLKTRADKDLALVEAAKELAVAEAVVAEKEPPMKEAEKVMQGHQQEMEKQQKAMEEAKAKAFDLMEKAEAELAAKKEENKQLIESLTLEKSILENELTATQDSIAIKTAELNELKGQVGDTTAESLAEKKSAAEQALQDAKTQFDDLTAQVNEKKEALKTVATEAESLKATYDAENAKLQNLEKTLLEKNSEIDDLEKEVKLAQDNLEKAKNGEKVVDEKKVAELEQKKQNLETQLGEAQKAANALKQEIDELSSQVSEKEELYRAKQRELEDLQTTIANLNEQVADLDTDKKQTEELLANQTKLIEDTNAQLSEKDAEVDQLNDEISELEEERENKEARLAEIDTRLQELDRKSEENQAQAEKIARWKNMGIAGFYEYIGADEALQILKGEGRYAKTDSNTKALFASYTDITNENDATSLKNVKAALDLIELGNKIRTGNYKDVDDAINGENAELKISTSLMALAEVNANWSQKTGTIGHASDNGQASASGENAAWGYGVSNSNLDATAYAGWYKSEKVLYEEARTKQNPPSYKDLPPKKTFGHYTNLMQKPSKEYPNPGVFYYTGFGHSTYNGDFVSSDVQDFNIQNVNFDHYSDGSTAVTNGQTFTLSEFRAKLAEYEELLASGDNNADAEKTKLEQEKQTINTRLSEIDQELKSKNQSLSRCNDEIASLEETLKQAEGDKKRTQGELQTIESSLRDANTQLLNKSMKQGQLESEVTEAQQEANKLKQQAEEKSQQYSSKTLEIQQLSEQLETTEQELNTAREGTNPDTSAAELALKKAEEKLSAARASAQQIEEERRSQDSIVIEASKRYQNKRGEINSLNGEIAALEPKLDQQTKLVTSKEEEFKATTSDHNSALKRDELSQELKTLETIAKKNTDRLTQIPADLEKANADKTILDETQLDKNLAWENGFAEAPKPSLHRRFARAIDDKHPRTNLDASMMDAVNELRAQYAAAEEAYKTAKEQFDAAKLVYDSTSKEYKDALSDYLLAKDRLEKIKAAIVDEEQKLAAATNHTATLKQTSQKPKHMKKADEKKLPQTSDPISAGMMFNLTAAGLGSIVVGLKRRRNK